MDSTAAAAADSSDPSEPPEEDHPEEEHEEQGASAPEEAKAADEEPSAPRPRQQQRRKLLDITEIAAPAPEADAADPVPSAEEPAESADGPAASSDEEDVRPEPEPDAADTEEAAPSGDEAPPDDAEEDEDVEETDASGDLEEEEEAANEEPADSEEPSSEHEEPAATRSSRSSRHKKKISTRLIVIICACIAAVAAIGIWQWSANTPRARMTQALKDGDIMLACQIYDEELRDEGLTANEVYYLCAAAEKIADDFEEDATGESYQGRILLLDRLMELPYGDVQDAVIVARQRVEGRHSLLGRLSAAQDAERRGDYIAAIEQYDAAIKEFPDNESLRTERTRLEDLYRTRALDSAKEYAQAGNVAQARQVLLGAMMNDRFAADSALRSLLDEITNEQIQKEGVSGAARHDLDMSRLGQAAFLMENVTDLPNATSHLTVNDLAGVLAGLYQWRDYNTSPIAGTDPVLAVVREALPERTDNAQWPLRVAEKPIQLLCDALFGQRAENVNLAKVLGPELFGSYKYDDGWYYFADMTAPEASVAYADPAPLPHLQDNTYRFYSASSDRNDDRLYTMEIRPTLTSPFGFTVSSVVTIAEGRDARAEAEGTVSEAPATQTPEPTPSAQDEDEEPAVSEAPQLAYAPQGSLTGGMVFPDSDLRFLTAEDLSALTSTYSSDDIPGLLDLARNEIYARRGHIFSDPSYQDFFAQYAWYSPSHAVSDSELNEYELQNLQQIAAWQAGL